MRLLYALCIAGVMALDLKSFATDIARHPDSYVTNTVPEKLRVKRVVAILGSECGNSRRLENALRLAGIDYFPYYTEQNLDMQNYVAINNQGKVPILFEDGKQVADINEYLHKHAPHIQY